MHNVTFLSRAMASKHIPVSGSVLISIHDKSEPKFVPGSGWADVLYLSFHDMDTDTLGLDMFSTGQARQVLDFAEKHQSCAQIMVHCQMGQSRSGAVAMFLSEKYAVPCFKGTNPVSYLNYKIYNKLVYRVLHNVDNNAGY